MRDTEPRPADGGPGTSDLFEDFEQGVYFGNDPPGDDLHQGSFENVDPVEEDPYVETEGTHSDEGGSSSSESDGSGAGPRPRRLLHPPVAPTGTSFIRHAKSRVCHLRKDGYVRRLMCGRPISQAYVAPGLMRYDTGVCSQSVRSAAAGN